MTIPQVDLTIVKDIMTKLAMNLGYLLKDPRKCHGGETIDKSTLDKSQSIPKLQETWEFSSGPATHASRKSTHKQRSNQWWNPK